jgi:hypothetical protein
MLLRRRYLQRLTLKLKTGIIAMSLIEEKTDLFCHGLSGRCDRCLNVASLREMFHATGATKLQRSQCLFITAPALPGI